MRALTALFLSLLLSAPVFAQDTEEADTIEVIEAPTLQIVAAEDVTLEQYLWVSRPLVVFADSPLDPRFEEQIELLLDDAEELLIRDVVVITDTCPEDCSGFREKLRPRGFSLVLIGKDGKVKLRKPAPWDVREITHAIDKWPIRLKEIRDAQGKD